jgi:putative addiction module component (TIGR02574 family)
MNEVARAELSGESARRIDLPKPLSGGKLVHGGFVRQIDILDQGEIRMNPEVMSVFDLSPSEKLQLVEDLWDDLATTPEDVPVHDWQKEELARRKANLLKNPASGLS